jgi:hypothetical protein
VVDLANNKTLCEDVEVFFFFFGDTIPFLASGSGSFHKYTNLR